MTQQATSGFSDLPWFALRVRPRHEKSVVHMVEAVGYEPFLPVIRARHLWNKRWQEMELPLFPGYLFARFDRNGWARVMNIPGVIGAVRFGKLLASVEESEINSLRLVQASGYAVEPVPYFAAGREIEIHDGPLAGLHGQVMEDKGQQQLVLSVTLLQRSVRVKIERESVTGMPLPCVARAVHAAL